MKTYARGKRIRSVSKRLSKRLEEYRERKADFLSERKAWTCPVSAFFGGNKKVTEIHHLRGRAGRLLNDERFWLGVSRSGHCWIHANPDRARAMTSLCKVGEWGKQEP